MSHNWKTFTPEQVSELRANKWVKSVTEKMVRFTREFKEEFWRQYSEEGKIPNQIVASMGLDPEVLGESRISGILMHIKEESVTGEFSDVRQLHAPDNANMPPSKQLIKMQHEVEYLKQEIEFIKKTILAERKAGRL